ncbi:MAG TPA: ABC transporter permease subunit [Anaeromyxobacteraceae bacterium]|nr:ABC transporter permease subunit [Anaeromyxobacteraceae bacterium]
MTWMRSFWVVFAKEVREGIRDRRALVAALFFPFLGPALLAVMLALVSQSSRRADEVGVDIPVAGRENAPNLAAFLEQGARLVDAPADPEAAVRRGEVDVVVVLPPEFAAALRAGRPAPVRVITDESRQQARPAAAAAERLLAAWARQTGAQRLVLRGIHPSVVEPLALERVDVSTPASRAAALLATIPFFLVMAVFTGGMPVAIDATAGERERQSLEPLFAAPLPRSALVLAKMASASVFSALALVETTVGFGLVPLALPPARIGFSMHLDPWVLLAILALCAPVVALACALMVTLAARARNFRAAQTTLSLLMLVPALPGMVLGLLSARPPPALYAVPFLGEQLVVSRLLRAETVEPARVALSSASTLLAAALVAMLAARTFERGQPLFDS